MILSLLILLASPVFAGPWTELPSAVRKLASGKAESDALRVLSGVESSMERMAAEGDPGVLLVMYEAYSSAIEQLTDADDRLGALAKRLAAALLNRAGRETSKRGELLLACAEVAPESECVDRLRTLLQPPEDPRPGQRWKSPVDGAVLVYHPAVTFTMGCSSPGASCKPDERYVRRVKCGGFWADAMEVTNAQYLLCMEAGWCSPPLWGPGLVRAAAVSDLPVVGVGWEQALAYASWCGRELPSEAQWERMARGKLLDRKYPWGKYRFRDRANVRGLAGADKWQEPAPVASFRPTGYGIFDIAGNVAEWCLDRYHPSLMGAPSDCSPWEEGGSGRVVRGGSWRTPLSRTRVSARGSMPEDGVRDDVGFRCVLPVPVHYPRWRLLELARQAFGIRPDPSAVLTSRELAVGDRLFLARWAATWASIEGKHAQALVWAVALLERDPEDTVARQVIARLVSPGSGDNLTAFSGQLCELLAEGSKVVSGEWFKDLLRKVLNIGRSGAGGDPRCVKAAARAGVLSPGVLTPGIRLQWPKDGKEMVWIPGGRFEMGGRGEQALEDERPVHTVRVPGFWLDSHEVTNLEYDRCVSAGACSPPVHSVSDAEGGLPVVWVTWEQASRYCKWAGKRLPSEAEWEYACRAGATTPYPWGEDWLAGRANAFGKKGKDEWAGLAPVGSFYPNPLGLFDMVGNAAEWVADSYHSSYSGAPVDGSAWVSLGKSTLRVVRGGTFSDFPPKLRCSARRKRPARSADRAVGFRCAASFSQLFAVQAGVHSTW